MKAFTQTTLATALLFGSSVYGQYAINPASVSNSTRQAWCFDQTTQCPLICLQTEANSAETSANDCDWQALQYSCVCSNGISPNVSEYSQTLPFFICQEWGNQCVHNCGGNSACQSACREDHPCGALNPTRQNTSTLTGTKTAGASSTSRATAAATTDSSGDVIYTGFASSPTSDSSDSDNDDGSSDGAVSTTTAEGSAAAVGLWALNAGPTFGSLALIGGFIGGFAVLL